MTVQLYGKSMQRNRTVVWITVQVNGKPVQPEALRKQDSREEQKFKQDGIVLAIYIGKSPQ
ncbi:MAG: hypothetical protein AAGU75_02535 [Bacillota bacterium]